MSCTCANWVGFEKNYTSSFPSDQFETLDYEILGDYHGATPHRGRLKCIKCGATYRYVAELMSTSVEPEVSAG